MVTNEMGTKMKYTDICGRDFKNKYKAYKLCGTYNRINRGDTFKKFSCC